MQYSTVFGKDTRVRKIDEKRVVKTERKIKL